MSLSFTRLKDVLLTVVTGAMLIVSTTGLVGQVILWATTQRETPLRLLGAAVVVFVIRYILVDGLEMKGSFGTWLPDHLIPVLVGGIPSGDDSQSDGAILKLPRIFQLIFPELTPPDQHRSRGSGGVGNLQDEGRLKRWALRGLYIVAFLLLALAAALTVAAACLAAPAFIKRYNFAIASTAVIGLMGFVTARRSFLALQNWKRIKEEWLKLPAIPGVLILGFGAKIGTPEWLQGIIPDGSSFAQLTGPALGAIVGLAVVMYFMAWMFMFFGRTSMDNEESQVPFALFVLALVCAWISNAGLYTLTMYGCVVALCAYLPA